MSKKHVANDHSPAHPMWPKFEPDVGVLPFDALPSARPGQRELRMGPGSTAAPAAGLRGISPRRDVKQALLTCRGFAGHVVAAFPSGERLAAAQRALQQGCLAAGNRLRLVTAASMAAQLESDLRHASPSAWMSREANVALAHLVLARLHHHFLLVEAEDDEHAAEIAALARMHGAESAQHFGRQVLAESVGQNPARITAAAG